MGVIGKLQRLAELRHYSSTLRSAAFHSLRTRRALRRELAVQHEWTALIERGILTEESAAKLEEEVKQALAEAEQFARDSPEPALETLLEDVYA